MRCAGNPHGDGGVAIVAHRTHPRTDLGVLQEQEKADERRNRQGGRKESVNVVLDAKQRHRGGDRRENAARRRTEHDANAFLQDQRQAKRCDNRQCGNAAHGLNHDSLDQRAENESDQGRDDKSEPEVSGRFQREPGDDRADHEEVAVRDIDDVEQAENDGEAESDEGDDQPPYQPVQCEQKQRIHHVTVRAARRPISSSHKCPIIAGLRQALIGPTSGWARGMSIYRRGRDHVPVDIEFLRRQSERQSDKLRQMQHRHIELLPKVLFDLVLKAVEHGVAERAGGHHRFGPAGLGCEDVLPGELDGNALVMARRCGSRNIQFSRCSRSDGIPGFPQASRSPRCCANRQNHSGPADG